MPVPSRQTIFVDGYPPYIVERDRSWPSSWAADAWMWAHSMALICPRCLKQWAILHFEGDENIHPQGAFCEEHGDGRLLLRYGSPDKPLLAALPPDLLRREFELAIRFAEQGDRDGT